MDDSRLMNINANPAELGYTQIEFYQYCNTFGKSQIESKFPITSAELTTSDKSESLLGRWKSLFSSDVLEKPVSLSEGYPVIAESAHNNYGTGHYQVVLAFLADSKKPLSVSKNLLKNQIVKDTDNLVLVYIKLCDSSFSIITHAENKDNCLSIQKFLKKKITSLAGDPSSDTIQIVFWKYLRSYVDYDISSIKAPDYKDLKGNYSSKVSAALDTMASWKEWPEGGKLCLWHGPPGTGKTYAIRALAKKWDWARFHYIVEPSRLFAAESDYMFKIIDTLKSDLLNDPSKNDSEKHHVLILEDTGELLSADARTQVGAGLGKFLNLLDGILGQDLRLSVIVTTNESLGKLHKAVERPGRCLVEVSFDSLSVDETNEWLKKNNLPEGDEGLTLAELYEKKNPHRISSLEENVKEFGFS